MDIRLNMSSSVPPRHRTRSTPSSPLASPPVPRSPAPQLSSPSVFSAHSPPGASPSPPSPKRPLRATQSVSLNSPPSPAAPRGRMPSPPPVPISIPSRPLSSTGYYTPSASPSAPHAPSTPVTGRAGGASVYTPPTAESHSGNGFTSSPGDSPSPPVERTSLLASLSMPSMPSLPSLPSLNVSLPSISIPAFLGGGGGGGGGGGSPATSPTTEHHGGAPAPSLTPTPSLRGHVPRASLGPSPLSVNTAHTATSSSGTSPSGSAPTTAAVLPSATALSAQGPFIIAPSLVPSALSQKSLLIPTDRPLEELEENWLPRLGRLRVEGEVLLPGFALWDLSRTHFSLSITTYTGKPTDCISCYMLLPANDLSQTQASATMDFAHDFLRSETNGVPRMTEYGTLIVSSPATYGKDISPILSGDLREAWPYLVLNTGLRRLGCGGRAVMGLDYPNPPVQRKFCELYSVKVPLTTNGAKPQAQTPPTSPTAAKQAFGSPASPASVSESVVVAVARGHERSISAAANPHTPAPATAGASSMATSVNATATNTPISLSPKGTLSKAHMHPSVMTEPLYLTVVEVVKLVQAALALWGLYGRSAIESDHDPELDGLFCDETKTGIFAWRRAMGMEAQEDLKLEKETSGGCIDPKTFSALLGSVTSARYQLAMLDAEKDPFSAVRRFLASWRAYQVTAGAKTPELYLSVAGMRQLSTCYSTARKGHATDALKVHKLLFTGVANAASSVSANLKGGGHDDTTPLRKREYHPQFRGGEHDDECGLGLILPEGEVGTVAAPDVITTDLEAFKAGILKSREKDWDVMGARRLGELWSGHVAALSERHHGRLRSALARRKQLQGDDDGEDSARDGGTSRKGAKIGPRKGALFGGLMNRRHAYDTASDSEAPQRMQPKLKVASVPTVIEPTPAPEDPDESLPSISRSGATELHYGGWGNGDVSDGQSLRSGAGASRRFGAADHNRSAATLATAFGGQGWGGALELQRSSGRRSSTTPSARSQSGVAYSPQSYGRRSQMMLRTASDGADVLVDEAAHEWTISNPHGTGKREHFSELPRPGGDTGIALNRVPATPRRPQRSETVYDQRGGAAPATVPVMGPAAGAIANSVGTVVRKWDGEALTIRLRRWASYGGSKDTKYRKMRVTELRHLQTDVDMVTLVWEMRKRERALAKRADHMAILERSSYTAMQTLFDTGRSVREKIEKLEGDVRTLKGALVAAASEDVDRDRDLQKASGQLQFFLSEDVQRPSLKWALRELEKDWEDARSDSALVSRTVEGEVQESHKSWWRFW